VLGSFCRNLPSDVLKLNVEEALNFRTIRLRIARNCAAEVRSYLWCELGQVPRVGAGQGAGKGCARCIDSDLAGRRVGLYDDDKRA